MLFGIVGLDVREVAHDVQMQVSRYVISERKLLNSYNPGIVSYLFGPVLQVGKELECG